MRDEEKTGQEDWTSKGEGIVQEESRGEERRPLEQLGLETAYEATIREYESYKDRSAKLDQKVYILLSVCAFLFITLFPEFGELKSVNISWGGFENLVAITESIFIILLLLLVGLLFPVNFRQLSLSEILDKDMFTQERIQVIRYISWRYRECWLVNEGILDKRYKVLRLCVILLFCVIISLVILMLSVYFPKVLEGGA